MVFSLIKIFFVIRLYAIFNPWNNAATKAICLSYDVTPGFMFSIRSSIQYRPFLFFSFILLSLLLISESILRSIEYSVIDVSLPKNEKPFVQLISFHNVIWYLLCRASNFNYGKFCFQTYEGQIIFPAIASMLWIIICFIVIRLTSKLKLTTEKKKVYFKLKKLANKDNKEAKAANVIIELIQLKRLIIENKILESQKERTRNIIHIFIMTLLLNKDTKNFINDQKISDPLQFLLMIY